MASALIKLGLAFGVGTIAHGDLAGLLVGTFVLMLLLSD